MSKAEKVVRQHFTMLTQEKYKDRGFRIPSGSWWTNFQMEEVASFSRMTNVEQVWAWQLASKSLSTLSKKLANLKRLFTNLSKKSKTFKLNETIGIINLNERKLPEAP